eukprot:COSAG01_NODE_9994_length_2280_cov_4.138469_1_plen_43_part_10
MFGQITRYDEAVAERSTGNMAVLTGRAPAPQATPQRPTKPHVE